ncbi:MAG: hypothetical protein IH600_07210 [Bacteroidetes bacterium]|nr:hypothetical protein [Bacteroidota bacterium]
MSFARIMTPLLRRVRMVLPMALGVGVLVYLSTNGGDVLFRFAGISVSQEALTAAGEMVFRLLSIAAISILFSLLVPMAHVVSGLRSLRVPAGLIAVAWLTERFLALLSGDARRMLDGVRARSGRLPFPRRILLAARLSLTFLIRSVDRSERMADALTARGFTGHVPLAPGVKWTRSDSIITLLSVLLITLTVAL